MTSKSKKRPKQLKDSRVIAAHDLSNFIRDTENSLKMYERNVKESSTELRKVLARNESTSEDLNRIFLLLNFEKSMVYAYQEFIGDLYSLLHDCAFEPPQPVFKD